MAISSTGPNRPTPPTRGFAHRLCAIAAVLAVMCIAIRSPGQSHPPPDWAATLRSQLRSDDPSLRGEAALALATVGNPGDVDAIAR
ncbi:MAG: hypothetical protein KDB80_14845, partial [Planctomycetes bacterium]|nr:hypothetical protein [Planctomycetota bacterium]